MEAGKNIKLFIISSLLMLKDVHPREFERLKTPGTPKSANY
ncbi:MAG: hypothetical protein JWR54_610 [Mucilaginibacter sp.]|nr:hypothetical protein [Mucilaginibacter sp.]